MEGGRVCVHKRVCEKRLFNKKHPKMLQTPAFRVKSTGGIYPDTQISILVRRVQTGSRKLILGQCRHYALETVCQVAHLHRVACCEVTVRYSKLFHKRLSTCLD